MANHVGAKLSRLIRERSYAGGELKRLDRSMEALMPVLAPLLAERNVLKRRRRKVMAFVWASRLHKQNQQKNRPE